MADYVDIIELPGRFLIFMISLRLWMKNFMSVHVRILFMLAKNPVLKHFIVLGKGSHLCGQKALHSGTPFQQSCLRYFSIPSEMSIGSFRAIF